MRKLKVTTLRRSRFQHGATVTAVAITRDGGTFVTGGEDGRIKVWDAETGFVHHTTKHEAAIACLALTGDETWIIAGDALGRAAIVALDSQSPTRTSEVRPIFSGAHGWPLRTVAITASGTIVFGAGSFEQRHDIYGDRDDPAQLRAFESLDQLLGPASNEDARGRLVHAFEDRRVVPTLHVDGDVVWVSGGEAALRSTAPALDLWEPGGAPPVDRRASEAWALASAAATPPVVAIRGDGVLSADGSITRGDATAKVVLPPESFAFALGPAGEIVVGTKTGVLVTFDRESAEARLFDDIHPGGVRSLAVSEDGRYAISGGIDGHVRTWDLARRQLIALSTGDPRDAVHAITTNATHVFSGDRAGGTTLSSLPSLEAPARFTHQIKSWWGLGAIAIDAAGETLAQATMTEVVLWRARDGEQTARIAAGFAVSAMAFRPDGTLLILETSAESRLRLFRGEKEIARCRLDGNATAMDVGPTSVRLGFADGAVMSVAL